MIDLENLKPDIRYLKDMKNVIHDKEWLKTASDDLELYYMYRGLEKKDDLRYDITVIPSLMMGREFVKTKGHNHLVEEKYIILEGEAIFLVQKGKEKIEDVYAIKAKKGDEVTIPADYDDHITINPSSQELKLGNWISQDCKNDYSVIQKMAGACYFCIKDPNTNEINWIKNKNYTTVPDLRFE